LNNSGGSIYDKVIYTVIKDASSYSPIVSSAEGCSWFVEFEDLTNLTFSVPADYSGSGSCSYSPSLVAYNENDAIDVAIYGLLQDIDLDSDLLVDILFSENDLVFTSTEVEGIPFTWDTEAQVRVWQ
jgi:hypothetical protein